ncbi:MAG: 7-cyano-7-deazaguanine synthase [Rhodospirillaceae bacterium]|nr:7-cyano-7-deazaguanine synthase [Rhodospirillaceae bacterium]
MRIVCAPEDQGFQAGRTADLGVVLYGHTNDPQSASVGAAVRDIIQRRKLKPAARAWDLLTIALSVIAADTGARRSDSPDGWTRQLNLDITVGDAAFWTSQSELLVRQLHFLTTDLWNLSFSGGGIQPVPEKPTAEPDQDSVVLLSGGLDSLVGTIDLVTAHNKKPYAVSQVSQGDKKTQCFFASKIGGGLGHLQLNHNADCPGENERSQRARSIIFLSYGVLLATSLARYYEGGDVTLYVCENGFISINPPLTDARLGSLSTRTTHPVFLGLFQQLLDAAGLRVTIKNPYQFCTKGEMLKGCVSQQFLFKYAHVSTSCGRYARNGYKHCGRCLPCLIRRAAFDAWGVADQTEYVFADLARDDKDHAQYDDVRSAAMAVAAAKTEGLAAWAGPSLSTALLGDITPYRGVVGRGLDELASFLRKAGVN